MALSLLRQVGRVYRRHPMISNMGLYGSLYFLGDLSQQTICGCPPDLQSATRVAAVGAGIFGPFYTYWYKFLDSRLPGAAVRTVAKKVVIDQMVAGLAGVYLFYVGRCTFYVCFCVT